MPIISPDPKVRKPAASDVLDWNTPDSWLPIVPQILPLITHSLEKHYLLAPTDFPYCDDLNWLEDRIYSETRQKVDIRNLMVRAMRAKFTAMRTCHSTRIESVDTIYHEGLKPLKTAVAQRRLKTLLESWKILGVDDQKFSNAVAEVGDETRCGRVWFDANEAHHYKCYGHYLLYGGEYLHSIAIRMGTEGKMRSLLRSVGKPTLFVCDVPLEEISDYQLGCFAGEILSAHFLRLEGRDLELEELFASGAAISIKNTLRPERIIGHYHPKRIYDVYYDKFRRV